MCNHSARQFKNMGDVFALKKFCNVIRYFHSLNNNSPFVSTPLPKKTLDSIPFDFLICHSCLKES